MFPFLVRNVMLQESTQAWKKKTSFRSVAIDPDAPPDIDIFIYPTPPSYGMIIKAGGGYVQGGINITESKLHEYNKTLQSTFTELLLERQAPDRVLRELAKSGKSTFDMIFADPGLLSKIKSLSRPGASIEITATDFFIPWEMIYDNNQQQLTYEDFWGMKYVISRTARKEKSQKPVLNYSLRPNIGLLTSNKLPYVETEIQFFTDLDKKGTIQLSLLRALDANRIDEEFRYLQTFCREPLHVAQFACHAYRSNTNRRRIALELTEKFPIDVDDLRFHGVVLDSSPLVILNACGTGAMNAMSVSKFTEMFLAQGALGVVATECDLQDDFGAQFTKELYKHFLNGEPLGECLLKTRRHFLDVHNNPAALLYSMYAPSSIRLQRIESPEPVETRVHMADATRNAVVPARFNKDQASQTERRLHAVIVGIDNYQDPLISDLQFAGADARSINDALQRTVSAEELNAVLLLNENATLNRIRTVIGEEIARAARPDDLVVLFFAGHGAPELDDPVEPPKRYLITHDTEYKHVFATALDLENDFVRLLQRIRSNNVIVFIDSCFSGMTGGRTFAGPAFHLVQTKFRTGELTLRNLDLGEGRVVISACKDDQLAFEDPELAHGVFTYCLLQVLLKGSQSDPTISLTTLYDEIVVQVTKLTNGSQRPTLNGHISAPRLPRLRSSEPSTTRGAGDRR